MMTNYSELCLQCFDADGVGEMKGTQACKNICPLWDGG